MEETRIPGPEAGELTKDFSKGAAQNTTMLAFMGDAVYELYIRELLVRDPEIRPADINRACISYVRAGSQAKAAYGMLKTDFLVPDEIRLLKRARNHTNTSRPRGATKSQYQMATGLEALVGYLYLSNQQERLGQVLEEAVRIIQESK